MVCSASNAIFFLFSLLRDDKIAKILIYSLLLLVYAGKLIDQNLILNLRHLAKKKLGPVFIKSKLFLQKIQSYKIAVNI